MLQPLKRIFFLFWFKKKTGVRSFKQNTSSISGSTPSTEKKETPRSSLGEKKLIEVRGRGKPSLQPKRMSGRLAGGKKEDERLWDGREGPLFRRKKRGPTFAGKTS